MNKKAALQISFAWLFAIIVGGFILFLTIFAVTKMMGTQETITVAKAAKEMGVLLNPLETGFETGKTTSITFPVETKIYNRCDNNDPLFGRQKIRISQKSFDKWTETDINVSFVNKYLFSYNYVEGKKFYLFSKPFNFPFKVTDLIYVTSSSDNYCFYFGNTQDFDDIKDELYSLNQKNIFTETENCPDGSINVCFDNFDECDIDVDYGSKTVEKKNEDKLKFIGDALMYAAIFSESQVYNCQLQRLMKRTDQLAQLYINKETFVSQRGCDPELGGDLGDLSTFVKGVTTSADLNIALNNFVNDIGESNELNSVCKLW